MESQQTLKNWAEHVANGCCHIYTRYEKHELDFTRFVVIETLNRLVERYAELPDDFYQQVEELKRGFSVNPQPKPDTGREATNGSPVSLSIVGSAAGPDQRPGKVLQILTNERDMTCEDVAAVLGCSVIRAGKIFSGEDQMTPGQIVAAANRFSVSPAAFFRDVNCSVDKEDFVIRASLEFQLWENAETLPHDGFDCLIDCSRAIAKLHGITTCRL